MSIEKEHINNIIKEITKVILPCPNNIKKIEDKVNEILLERMSYHKKFNIQVSLEYHEDCQILVTGVKLYKDGVEVEIPQELKYGKA
jgi:hypothetical protein